MIELLFHRLQPTLQRGRGPGSGKRPAGTVHDGHPSLFQQGSHLPGQTPILGDDPDPAVAGEQPAPHLDVDGPRLFIGLGGKKEVEPFGYGADRMTCGEPQGALPQTPSIPVVDGIEKGRQRGRPLCRTGESGGALRQPLQQAANGVVGGLVASFREVCTSSLKQQAAPPLGQQSPQPIQLCVGEMVKSGEKQLVVLSSFLRFSGQCQQPGRSGLHHPFGCQLSVPGLPQGVNEGRLSPEVGLHLFVGPVGGGEQPDEIGMAGRGDDPMQREFVEQFEEGVGQCPGGSPAIEMGMLHQHLGQHQLPLLRGELWSGWRGGTRDEPLMESMYVWPDQGENAPFFGMFEQFPPQSGSRLEIRQQDGDTGEIRQHRECVLEHHLRNGRRNVAVIGEEVERRGNGIFVVGTHPLEYHYLVISSILAICQR